MNAYVFNTGYLFIFWILYQTVTTQNPNLVTDKVMVAENSSVTLTCILPRAVPTAWLRNGFGSTLWTGVLEGKCTSDPSPLPEGFEYACVNATLTTLTILRVNRSQDGDRWQCSVSVAGVSTFSNNITINVQVPIGHLQLSPTFDPVSLIVNQPTTFKCTSDFGRPNPSIYWFKDNTTDDVADGINITAFSSTSTTGVNITISTLIFTPLKSDLGMRLYCSGNNGGPSVTSNIRPLINLLYGPTIPIFHFNGTNVDVAIHALSGTQFVLRCTSNGNPHPSFTWTYSGGSAIGEELVIPEIKPLHEGNVTCLARNVMLSSSGGTLTTHQAAAIFLHIDVPITQVALVGSNAQNAVLKENDTSTFECQSSPGKPPAIIHWYKDGGTKEIIEDDITLNEYNTTAMAEFSVKSFLKYQAKRLDNEMSIYCTASNVGPVFTSPQRSKLIIVSLPVIPEELAKTIIGANSVTLSWKYASGNHIFPRFIIGMKESNSGWTERLLLDISTNSTRLSTTLTMLNSSSVYSVRMYAENSLGRSAPSSVVSFTTLSSSMTDSSQSLNSAQSTQVGPIIGSISGGTVLGILLGITGIWFVFVRKNRPKKGGCSACCISDKTNTYEAKISSTGDATYSSIDAATPVQREHYYDDTVAGRAQVPSNQVELEGQNVIVTSYENIDSGKLHRDHGSTTLRSANVMLYESLNQEGRHQEACEMITTS
ncbi:hypothetical protein DPMN_128018 [Dreissena polymorpha]|uniref:Nephrin/kirre n=1 Tax=Dreissena polymorpha TaxID=45954 RepID=A0A9D4H283_DREPO|nr:hypothetical protein DPMN_128018 [Dreissena polymorpha]